MKNSIIKENPDNVKLNNKDLYYNQDNAYAFGFYKGKAYIGDPRRTHAQIKRDLLDRGDINVRTDAEYNKFPSGRDEFKHTGRLWTKEKIISFWNYPTESHLKGVISKLEKAGGMKIWNNGYRIEIIDKGGKLYRPTKKQQGNYGWDVYTTGKGSHIKLIPLEDYAGSQKQVGKEISHQKSPMLKKKKVVPKGIGSRKKIKGTKKGETPAATRDRLRKGLGDGIISVNDIIKESSNIPTTKREGLPRGKFPYLKTDGVSDSPISWEAKLRYWRKMIEKMIGYEVLE